MIFEMTQIVLHDWIQRAMGLILQVAVRRAPQAPPQRPHPLDSLQHLHEIGQITISELTFEKVRRNEFLHSKKHFPYFSPEEGDIFYII